MQQQTFTKVNINDPFVSLGLLTTIPAFITLFLSMAVGALFLLLSAFNADLLNIAGVAFIITTLSLSYIVVIPRLATKRAMRLIAQGHGTIS